MTRYFAAAALAALLAAGWAIQGAEPEPTHPPHARPLGGVIETPLGVAAAQEAGAGTWIAEIGNYLGDLEREREAAEEAARLESARRPPSGGVAPAGTRDACTGFVIPGDIVWRESRCDFGAVSPGGQYVGAYQFDARHWDAGSGWGGCADLGDWRDPEAQHECARRLSSDGTNLRPWGG